MEASSNPAQCMYDPDHSHSARSPVRSLSSHRQTAPHGRNPSGSGVLHEARSPGRMSRAPGSYRKPSLSDDNVRCPSAADICPCWLPRSSVRIRQIRLYMLPTPIPNTFDSTRFYHLRIIWFGKDLIDGFFITHSRSHAVSRNIFVSVACQMFITHGISVCSAKYLEMRMQAFPCSIQNFLVSSSGLDSVGSVFYHRMWKNVGLKSRPIPLSFAKSTHFWKCFGSSLSRSANSRAVLENRIARMHIDLFLTRHQAHRLVHVLKQFFRGSCFSRIISCRLDPSGQRTIVIKSDHVVSPASNAETPERSYISRSQRLCPHLILRKISFADSYLVAIVLSSFYEEPFCSVVLICHVSYRTVSVLIGDTI